MNNESARSEGDGAGASPPDSANGPVADLQRNLESSVQGLKDQAKELIAAARELAKVANSKIFYDVRKLESAFEKLGKKVDPAAARRHGIEPVLDSLAAYVASAPERLRRDLGRGLKQACEAEGLDFRVVSMEAPVEVRIPPVSILLDFKKGEAVFQFARDPIGKSRLVASDIVKTYHKTVDALNRGLTPDEFFEKCRVAYKRVLRFDGLKDGDRVELLRFLPEFAFLMQTKRFQENPTLKNFRPYSRARFAYDVYRLRQAKALVRNGIRINFGVATGTTATRKSRVIYMEDPFGAGEYKLTVFFSRA